MFEPIKQLFLLVMHGKKLWMIPLVLMLVIVTLFIISAFIAPVPFFLYPLI